MQYTSKPETSKTTSIFTATFGAILLYFSGFVSSGFGAVFWLFLGLILLFLTVIATTASYSIIVDSDSGLITKRFESCLVKRQWTYALSQFNSVHVDIGGRGAFGEGVVVYSVQLKGTRTLSITPWSDDKYKVELEAKNVADYLNIPHKINKQQGKQIEVPRKTY